MRSYNETWMLRVFAKILTISAVVFFATGHLRCYASRACDTIPMQALQTGERMVELSWSPLPGESVKIMRQYPGDEMLTVVTAASGGSWIDYLSRGVCEDTVKYCLCRSSDSGFAAVVVSDLEATSPAQWGVVTVDAASQKIVLDWDHSIDLDVMGYLVCKGTPSIAIDTVWGRENTMYVYDGSSEEVSLFRICAFDSCRKASALTDICNNIVLLLGAEPCSRDVTATWNSYQNMPGEIGIYELWTSENDATAVMRGSVSNQTTSITFEIGEDCRVLKAWVKAVSTDGLLTAVSNRAEYSLGTNERPEYLYLRKVSVGDDGKTVVTGQTDVSFVTDYYKVYRSVKNGDRVEVGRCYADNSGVLEWRDLSVDAGVEEFSYGFGVTDGCGRNEIRSIMGNTLRPVFVEEGGQAVLTWNTYDGWDGTTTYEVISSPIDGNTWRHEGSTNGTSMAGIVNNEEGTRLYRVLAFEGSDSHYKRGDSLQSVIVMYRPETTVWMPTAFTPLESTNNTFGPKFVYVAAEDYCFEIYNRMGLRVFSTNDTKGAWDGKYKGVLQPSDAYVYRITFRQKDGTLQVTKGSVLLIK